MLKTDETMNLFVFICINYMKPTASLSKYFGHSLILHLFLLLLHIYNFNISFLKDWQNDFKFWSILFFVKYI